MGKVAEFELNELNEMNRHFSVCFEKSFSDRKTLHFQSAFNLIIKIQCVVNVENSNECTATEQLTSK